MGALALALLAGVLSTLSPCVLPLLPIVLGTALTEHRFGPVALAFGVAVSYVAVGLFVATVGFAIGLDLDVFRNVAAALLIAIGTVLLLPQVQTRLTVAAGPFGNWAQTHSAGMSTRGLSGQFALGVLLGVVWSPCVGPTLGAASVLAAQGKNLGSVAATMIAFGIGAAAPLIVLGLLSREALMRWRDRLIKAGKGFKILLGGLLLFVGVLIFSGFDKKAWKRCWLRPRRPGSPAADHALLVRSLRAGYAIFPLPEMICPTPKTPNYFHGKTIVITGAASGIGRATAKIFAREGANGVCADMNEDGVAQTVEQVNAAGLAGVALTIDVTKRAAVKGMIQLALGDFGRVHFLFNPAGAAIVRSKLIHIDY